MLDGLLDGQMPGCYDSFKSPLQHVVTCLPCQRTLHASRCEYVFTVTAHSSCDKPATLQLRY